MDPASFRISAFKFSFRVPLVKISRKRALPDTNLSIILERMKHTREQKLESLFHCLSRIFLLVTVDHHTMMRDKRNLTVEIDSAIPVYVHFLNHILD